MATSEENMCGVQSQQHLGRCEDGRKGEIGLVLLIL